MINVYLRTPSRHRAIRAASHEAMLMVGVGGDEEQHRGGGVEEAGGGQVPAHRAAHRQGMFFNLFVCQFVCWSICPFVFLSVCLFVYKSFCLFVY